MEDDSKVDALAEYMYEYRDDSDDFDETECYAPPIPKPKYRVKGGKYLFKDVVVMWDGKQTRQQCKICGNWLVRSNLKHHIMNVHEKKRNPNYTCIHGKYKYNCKECDWYRMKEIATILRRNENFNLFN